MKKIVLLSFFLSFSSLVLSQRVDGGGEHSIFICTDGSVNSWGKNIDGQLGSGNQVSRKLADSIPGLHQVIAVASGVDYTLFLKNDGTVWSCGGNSHGGLGDGTSIRKSTPVQIPGLSGITAISASFQHSLFLKNDGTVWACGINEYGQLGDGTVVQRKSPVQVTGVSGIIAISAGRRHSLFLKNNGTVWTCGNNEYGALGDGTTVDKIVPFQIPGLSGITSIATGNYVSFFLKNGMAWGSGFNRFGQIGDGTTIHRSTPVQVTGITGITSISCGISSTFFLKNDSTVWACGYNQYGQLGDGTTENKKLPVPITALSSIITIGAGEYHTVFLKNNNTLWSCGNNLHGQLGDGTAVNKQTPVQINACIVPQPVIVDFSNFPNSICLGSNVTAEPNITGSNPQQTTIVDNTINVTAPKTITKNSHAVFVLDGNNQILRYGFNGTLQYTYNPGGASLSNILSITANDNDSVFANNGDGSIYTFPPTGGLSSVQSFFLGSTPVDMIFAPNNYAGGNVIVADNSMGIIGVNTHDPNGALNGTFYGDFNMVASSGISSFTLDNKSYLERRMLATDPQHNKLWSKKYYDASGGGNEDVKLLIDSISTQNMSLDFIDADTVNQIICVSSSTTGTLAVISSISSPDGSISSHIDSSFTSIANAQMPMGMVSVTNGSMPQFWIADKTQNKILRLKSYLYQIAPALPAGLKFNPLTGKIDGNALAASVPQTYQVIVSNGLGSDTTFFTFGVTPTGPLNNSVGTSNTSSVHNDGLTIKYYDPNNCSKLIEIADSIGGTSPGQTGITQNVLPIISVIANDTLIRRFTEIDAENPDASAIIRLYYSYQDIQLFNQSHGSIVLSNDTTATMQMAVLQMHNKPDGSLEPIVHSPVTASWSNMNHNWVVNVPVTKFSTFYAGDIGTLASFNCSTSGIGSISTTNNYYIWNYDTLFVSGTYVDTLINATGCDSIATLSLTLNATTVITPMLEKGISLYPNPSIGVLYLEILDPNVTIDVVRIVNLTGSEVYHANAINSKSQLDISFLPKGIYIVQVSSAQEKITKKIVLE